MPSQGLPSGILRKCNFLLCMYHVLDCSISAQKDGKAPGLLLPSGNSMECIWARVRATSRYTLCWGGVCLCGSFPIIIIFVFIVFAIIGSVCFPSIHLLIVLVVILIFLSLDSPVVPTALALYHYNPHPPHQPHFFSFCPWTHLWFLLPWLYNSTSDELRIFDWYLRNQKKSSLGNASKWTTNKKPVDNYLTHT